jgi:hypothetical protein
MKLRRALQVSLALLAGAPLAAPAGAAVVHIGGVDSQSQFISPNAAVTPGLLSFNDTFNSVNDPEPGVVTSSDLAGFDLLGANTRAWFNVFLSPLQKNGTSAFNPASTNINFASFNGVNDFAFTLFEPMASDPNIPVDILLTFSVTYIHVTNAAALVVGADPDGFIKLGNPSETATTSLLTVTGGALADLVGGIGTQARLEVFFVSPSPAIQRGTNPTGPYLTNYFNDDWTAGTNSPAPSSATTWNLTIIPEPSTAALLGFALVGLVALARRRAI